MHIRLHYVKPHQGFLPGCQWLGTVIDTQGNPGTLMLGPTGVYSMVRRGHAVPLDGDAVAVAMAEALARVPGRPVGPDGKLERCTVLLSASDIERARAAGQGNISLGLRIAIRAHVIPTDGSN